LVPHIDITARPERRTKAEVELAVAREAVELYALADRCL
jgi:hypothetical protein